MGGGRGGVGGCWGCWGGVGGIGGDELFLMEYVSGKQE